MVPANHLFILLWNFAFQLRESPMKAFGVGIVVAIALAIGAAISLSFVQETVAQAYSTGAARLDQQEEVNFYGR
jgi:hypothetical protein